MHWIQKLWEPRHPTKPSCQKCEIQDGRHENWELSPLPLYMSDLFDFDVYWYVFGVKESNETHKKHVWYHWQATIPLYINIYIYFYDNWWKFMILFLCLQTKWFATTGTSQSITHMHNTIRTILWISHDISYNTVMAMSSFYDGKIDSGP